MFPSSGFRLGKIFGIEIVINGSWMIIFILAGITFASIFQDPIEIFPELESYLHVHPVPGGPWVWVAGFLTAFVFFSCLLLHEISHSYVARRNGIPINRITLFVFGGVAEMDEDVKDPVTELKMALAGPAVTFLLSGLFYAIYRGVKAREAGGIFVIPFLYLSLVNLAIGIFNLLPGFPLDGGRVLRSIVWKATGSLEKATRIGSVCGQFVAAFLVAGGVYSLIYGNITGGFWFIILGLFLYRLAQASYRQTLFRLAAEGVTIGDIIKPLFPEIDADLPLGPLRDNYFTWYHTPAFPVYRDGSPVGVIFREDLNRVSPSEWDLLTAERIARPLGSLEIVEAGTSLEKVLRRILRGEKIFLVSRGGRIVGALTRDEIMSFVDARMEAARGR